MEKILLAHNRHWNRPYNGLYPRDLFQKLLKNLPVKHIQVLQGVRRSGKSTLFKLLINNLIESGDPMEILYLNLEDPFFIKYEKKPEKIYEIVETAQKLTGKKVRYLFLDEVQAITGWEKYAKTVYDNEEYKGRYLSHMVHPLSFSELLQINGIESYLQLVQNRATALAIVDTMLKYGSFVEVIDSDEELKRDIISSYYDTIILKDCVSNNHIRDIKSFKELSYYLISNIASPFSYSSLAKATGIHDKSAKEFVQISATGISAG
jgi:predicted AAA+ superfamily ATPase